MYKTTLLALWTTLSIISSPARGETIDPFCEQALSPQFNPSAEAKAQCVSEKTFLQQVIQAPELVLVIATARWCGPCHRLKGELPALRASLQGLPIKILSINYDRNTALLNQVFGIHALPSLQIFYQGKRRWSFKGAPSAGAIERDLRAALKAAQAGTYTIEAYHLLEDQRAAPLDRELGQFYRGRDQQ